MGKKSIWNKNQDGSFTAQVEDNTSLNVVPVHYAKGFIAKPARGTKWRACISHWDEATRTISRFGRDVYMTHLDTAKEAMVLAEEVYREAKEGVQA